jgi:hypothetical protein
MITGYETVPTGIAKERDNPLKIEPICSVDIERGAKKCNLLDRWWSR